MQKRAYKKEYIFAVQKKTNDLQPSKKNDKGITAKPCHAKNGRNGKAAGVA